MITSIIILGLPMAQAGIFINFDDYDTGNLSGQPGTGTSWAVVNGSPPNPINVAVAAGTNGSNGLVNTSTGGGTNFMHYGFNTSDSDLGFTFDKDASIVNYSFDFRPVQALDAPEGAVDSLFEFVICSSQASGFSIFATRIVIRNNGQVRVNNGGSWLHSEASEQLFTAGVYHTISGTLDYATKTHTIFVDGVQLFAEVNGGVLGFAGDPDNLFIRLNNLRAGSDAATKWRQWNVDNIALALNRVDSNLWAGYPVDPSGHVDTGSWMGWVNVLHAPYTYSSQLGWVYIEEDLVTDSGAWVHVFR